MSQPISVQDSRIEIWIRAKNVSHGTTLLQRHTLAGSLFGVLVCHIVGLL